MSVCLLTLITAPSAFPGPSAVTGDEVDLVFSVDSKKVMLTAQRSLVRVVIQDSFDIIRTSLMFTHAFPDGPLAIQFAKEALLRSALNHTPGAARIYQRLLKDKEYLWKIIPLVSQMDVNGHSTEAIHSHVLEFPFTDLRSKSGALLFLLQ